MTCINLLETFGDRYVIAFDEAYNPRNVPRAKLDVWMMTIACEGKGVTIYPHGGTTLAVEVHRRPSISAKLSALDGLKLHQDGDVERTYLFDVALFEAVAAIVKPRKKRQVSEERRKELASYGHRYGFGAQKSKLERAPTPETDSGPALAG